MRKYKIVTAAVAVTVGGGVTTMPMTSPHSLYWRRCRNSKYLLSSFPFHAFFV